MNILGDVFKELFKMFVADMRLTLSILIGVGVIGLLLGQTLVNPVVAGVLILLLCLGVLFEAVMRETRTRKPK
jgi:hypothetical protein